MITVKNISSATVVISAPDVKFRRKLAPGRTVNLSQEAYDEFTYNEGFTNLVRNGFLKVDGVNAEVNEIIEPAKTAVSTEELKSILEKRDITNFARIITNAAPATRDSVVALAVEMRVTDSAFSALIKKHCGVDIIDAIAAQSE